MRGDRPSGNTLDSNAAMVAQPSCNLKLVDPLDLSAEVEAISTLMHSALQKATKAPYARLLNNIVPRLLDER